MTFKNGRMTGVLSNMGEEEKIDKPFPKVSGNQKIILSTFLGYVMASEPKGLEVRKKSYTYQAVAEEDGEIYPESALIKEIEMINNIKTFKIINDFKEMKFTSYVTDQGDVLLTKAPVQGIATELVVDSKEAIKSFPFNEKNLILLFGDVPKGDRNALSELAKTPVKDKLPPPPKPSSKVGKDFGVPQGIGIQIKGNQTKGK
jgi:hypothetical protein